MNEGTTYYVVPDEQVIEPVEKVRETEILQALRASKPRRAIGSLASYPWKCGEY